MGNREPDRTAALAVDVVAPVNAKEGPTVALESAGELATRDLLHTTISRILCFESGRGASMSTARQASTAS